jgi:regulator of sigma D
MCRNFHDFFRIRNDSKTHASMYQMKVLNRNGSASDEEWEISRMYMALKFRKIRESAMEYDDESDEGAVKDDTDSDTDTVQEVGNELKSEVAK